MLTPITPLFKKDKTPSSLKATGFTSPADPYLNPPSNLEDLLILNPLATFYMPASGNDLEKAAVFDGIQVNGMRSRLFRRINYYN